MPSALENKEWMFNTCASVSWILASLAWLGETGSMSASNFFQFMAAFFWTIGNFYTYQQMQYTKQSDVGQNGRQMNPISFPNGRIERMLEERTNADFDDVITVEEQVGVET